MRTLCIWHLQYLQSFRNCCLFCTFWLIRNFYSGEAHHVNYRKHSLNDHFQHCAHCVYDIYSICKVFEMAVCFARIGLFEIWTALILTMLAHGERCSNHHFRHCSQCVSEIYSVLKLFEIAVCFAHFGTFEISTAVRWIMLTIANSLNHHFQHCAHCVYEIYSIFKAFEIAVCFEHFVVFEIWTSLAM